MTELQSNVEPLVSVVIPVYNSGELIRRSVESVITQIHGSIQIVLVNDGSDDDSSKVCEALAEGNERVIYICHEKNQGQTVTRNDGVAAASGEWMMFLDADDTIEPDAIASMLNMVASEDVDIVFAGYNMCRNSSTVTYLADLKSGTYSKNEFVSYLFDNFPSHVLTCIGSKLYRMSFIREKKEPTSNAIKTNYDMAFVIDALLSCNRVAYINQPVYNYIQREDSITYSYRKDMYLKICEARKKIPQLLKSGNCYKNKQHLFYRLQLELMSASLYQEIQFRKGYTHFRNCVDKIYESDDFRCIYREYAFSDKYIKEGIYVRLIRKKSYIPLYLYYHIKKVYRIVRYKFN